jgi:hypothetical protein
MRALDELFPLWRRCLGRFLARRRVTPTPFAGARLWLTGCTRGVTQHVRVRPPSPHTQGHSTQWTTLLVRSRQRVPQGRVCRPRARGRVQRNHTGAKRG